MKRILAITLALAGFSAAVNAQTLLYQWAFTNSSDTISNSAASYAITPGTGNLILTDVSGAVEGFTGLDGINPVVYFTNSNAGPGSGSGVDALGALVANGQGYSGAPTATAIATNLNLGSQFQFTVTFWVQYGVIVSGQFPRPVQFYQTPGYDVGGKGLGNHNGVGASLNGWASGFAASAQNGIANGTSAQQNQVSIAGNLTLAPGFAADSTTWYFEAITYDGTLTANNFITWVGTTNSSVQPFAQTANYGPINFTTNATVMIGGNDVNASPRALSQGGLADVRFYSGIVSSNNLEFIRNYQPIVPVANTLTPASVLIQPVSGTTFVSGSRTFSIAANGNPPNFTYLWRSNGVAITGATNASYTLSNASASANGASFLCSVTNGVGGTNSAAGVITMVTPAPGSYAQAAYANSPYSFWLINEPSNTVPVLVSDYANGHDGFAQQPTNMAFPSGPNSPFYSGFPANNTSIETIASGIFQQQSQLNMAGPGNYPNSGMTICGWINTPGLGSTGNGVIWNQVSDTAGGFGLLFGASGNNELDYQWGQNLPASGFTSGLIIPTNEWTFIALVISTNSTPDTNATIYVGSHSTGLGSVTDSTAVNGDLIGIGSDVSFLTLGRSAISSAENGNPYTTSTAQFSSVAVFYSALSPQTITNLYAIGAKGVSLQGVPDPSVHGNLLLTYPLGTLQQANVVQGPYIDVPGAVTPYSVPMSNSTSFFMVRPN
jgi:hypothetical protein